MMFGVIGVLKKGIWSMNEIKAMVDRVKDLEFRYQDKMEKGVRMTSLYDCREF
jgi:hypothetical protein